MKRILFALAALAVAGAAHADAALYAKKCASCHGKDGKPSAVGQKMGAKDLGASKLSEAEIHSLAKFVKGGLK